MSWGWCVDEIERLLRLEIKTDRHSEEIVDIKKFNGSLKEEFDRLDDVLKSIKNWVVGGIAFAAMEQMGLFGFLKKLFF